MRFYTKQHQFYCGIDLHARTMYVCILDHHGEILLHRNMPARQRRFSRPLPPIGMILLSLSSAFSPGIGSQTFVLARVSPLCLDMPSI